MLNLITAALLRPSVLLCLSALAVACGNLGPSSSDQLYLADIALANNASADTTWANLYVTIQREVGSVTKVKLLIGGLLNTTCAVSDYRHVPAGSEGEGSLETEYVTGGWDAGIVQLEVLHGVTAWRCWRNGEEIPCPPHKAIAIRPGDLRWEDSDGVAWHNAWSVSADERL